MIGERRHGTYLLIILITALLYGCVGPIKYAYHAPPRQESPDKSAEGLSIYIAPVIDRRPDVKFENKIGDIHSTVVDIYRDELFLSRRPALVIEEAFIKEFEGAGFKVISDARGSAEYALKAELLKFQFEIGAKDSAEIVLDIEILNTRNEKKLWSGVVKTSSSRYAGVFGDSRASISRYISETISKSFRKIIEKAGPGIEKMDRVGEGSGNGSSNGNEGYEGKVLESGRLIVKTLPARAKVYINGVYYGLSPMTLQLKPGIYRLNFKKDGFYEFRERAAVGSGRSTEMEAALKEKK